jgi:regulator of protease activity HflC (stomatin/prohibitin superfamily)
MSDNHQFILGILVAFGAMPLLVLAVRLLRVEVEDGETVLVTRFGRLAATLSRPGWHWMWDRYLPWTRVFRVSTRRDFRDISNIYVNDAAGTTVVVDIWLEFRIVDPARATFDVADWDRSLRNLVSHAVISILGSREFKHILCDRTQLGELLRHDISVETARWGIQVELAFIKNVSLLPEVSQQLFHAIAARLERAKADIEEDGRQRVAMLAAATSAKIATLVAEAKGQYPTAVGRAYAALKHRGNVFRAYVELYELSLMRPQQMVAFKDFAEGEIRAVDAAMLAPLRETST